MNSTEDEIKLSGENEDGSHEKVAFVHEGLEKQMVNMKRILANGL